MQKYKDELKTKKRKKLFLRLIVLVIVGIIGLIGTMYGLFFVGLFDVRNVTVKAPDGLHADISSTVNGWLASGFWKLNKGGNILFLSLDELASQLAKQFPKLEAIKITKNLPHALIISAGERKPIGILCLASERCFYFDETGIAFSEVQPSTGFLILNISDQRSRVRESKLGDEVVTQDWLLNIAKAKELLAKIDVNVSEFVIPADSFDEFYAKTSEGWKILFSNSTNITKQISSLAVFLRDKLTANNRTQLQYVDLKIQDRIYYK